MNKLMNVEDALCIVLKKTSHPVGTEDLFLSPDLVGRIVAKAVRANDAFPPFPASIMDGYAVCAPIEPGTYRVVEEIFAGQASQHRSLLPGEVVYITTGAMVPSGATGVVKVEETEKADESHVKINVMVDVGVNIREVGSDIAAGEVIVEVGHILTPTDLGLLATIGCITVTCYKKPVIGVLSTGDELVDYCETALGGSQIRDSNRLTLVSTLRADGYIVRDYGIGGDSFEVLKALLMKMSEECDVVVSSGGVSMGAADHVKPILGEIGTIHFQKLNLKPGKPTVFASLNHSNATTGDSKTVYFFGLPGNPVSCLVTKELFITPALKRLQGLTADQCLHPQVLVEVQGGSIALDAERVEYHRVSIAYGTGRGHLIARSTGNQRSSRLLSMQQAHGLLVLPQGPGIVHAGSILPALLLSPLHTLPPPALSVHPLAASLDQPTSSSAPSQGCLLSTVSNVNTDWKVIRTGILTISDRASQGVYSDESGPEIVKLLKKMNEEEGFPLTMTVVQTKIVPDEPESIQEAVEAWTNPSSYDSVDMLFTTGGTGFGPRDITPEVLLPLLHRQAPGIAQVLLNEGLKHTPLAVLSRPVVGTRHKTFIVTLPGSVKAIRENIVALTKLLPRIFELLKTGDCRHLPFVPSSTGSDETTPKKASMCECCR